MKTDKSGLKNGTKTGDVIYDRHRSIFSFIAGVERRQRIRLQHDM